MKRVLSPVQTLDLAEALRPQCFNPDSGSRLLRLSVVPGSRCVILGSRSVRRTCNHRHRRTIIDETWASTNMARRAMAESRHSIASQISLRCNGVADSA